LRVIAFPNPATDGIISFLSYGEVPARFEARLYDAALQPCGTFEWDAAPGYSTHTGSTARLGYGVYVCIVTVRPVAGGAVRLPSFKVALLP